jgi:hypothetical protein
MKSELSLSERITATSRRRAERFEEAATELRPYNDVGQ